MVPTSVLDLSIGCLFIGVILNIWLYGFSCLQFYLYYANFRSDRLALRLFVLFLFLADTLNAIFDLHFIYDYLVTHFGNMSYASVSNWSFNTDPIMTSIIAFSCQLFFAWRVYRLTKSWIWPVVITVLSAASLLGAIGTTIGVSIVLVFAEFQKFQAVVIVWLLCAALADVVITISLILTLHKSRTGFQATDDLITKLIRTTIQTGAVTTFFAVVDLILFLSSSTTLHLVFNLPLAKLYVNSLLSTLNARTAISNVIYAVEPTSSGVRATSSGHGVRHSAFNPSASMENKKPSVLDKFTTRMGRSNSTTDALSAIEKGIQITTISERFEERDGIVMSKSNSSLGADVSFSGMPQRPHSNSVGTSASGSSTEMTHINTITPPVRVQPPSPYSSFP